MPHPKFIIAGALIIGAISYLMLSGVNNSMVYYYEVPELLAKASELSGRGVRLSGHVAPGTIERNDRLSQVRFQTIDRETGQSILVAYRGLVPDTFKDDAQVVVEGQYDLNLGIFQANTLLAKCPSKYEAEEGAEYGADAE